MRNFNFLTLGIFFSIIFVSILSIPLNSVIKDALKRKGRLDIHVLMKERANRVINQVQKMTFSNEEVKVNFLVDSLENHAKVSQQNIIKLLKDEKASFESFWINNQLFVRDADEDLIKKIASFDQVLQIHESFKAKLDVDPPARFLPEETFIKNENEEECEALGLQWGVCKVEAHKAWDISTGEGIRVGMIDTGVRGSHEILRDNFGGEFSWMNPRTFSPEPEDEHGHGTHVMGSIVGTNGYGIAPKATWSCCSGCNKWGMCDSMHLYHCGQFMLCPTDRYGDRRNCSLRPKIVSNSWSGGGWPGWFEDIILSWHAANIIPVFSIGNSGPACNTASDPGDSENVIAVGATENWEDDIAPFSSKGPGCGFEKPNLSAPGTNILSSHNLHDSDYSIKHGTSMSAPHVSGTIALLLSLNKEATFEDIKKILFSSTDMGLPHSGSNCGNIEESDYPNNAHGHGRLNAYKAVLAQREKFYV